LEYKEQIMDNFQQFIVTSKYCRWNEELQRRETWTECVDRYYDYLISRFPETSRTLQKDLDEARQATKDLEVFPSMRALMTAGPAADVDDTCMYNCSYVAVNEIRSFSEIMYILCCGTGVGFSCESKSITQLPTIPQEILRLEGDIITVEDSREGWANAFFSLLSKLYQGVHPTWDTSKIRPAGARLKTFGGRASGPEPLEKLFRYVVKVFHKARGRQLKSIEVHDIVCMVGEIVIAGAVRRSALISLSDLHDREMATAKSGPWWELSGHRRLSNNSAVYTTKPSMSEFLDEWTDLYNSRSGERGICNREALSMLTYRIGRKSCDDWGTNPCSEIILRPNQFCNLSEVVIRDNDNLESLKRKVRLATLLGTFQSGCTNFPYLQQDWQLNCEEERLLGVSFTGVFDNKLMSGQLGIPKLRTILNKLLGTAQTWNARYAELLGITSSAAITCCKPSGTTSCVAGTSSGIHPRYAQHYIRRVRVDTKDPICQFMIDQGIPWEDCISNAETTKIFSFPLKAPEDCLVQDDLDPITHLEVWLEYQKTWCEHKPSVTISYKDDTFMDIGNWVWNNWDYVSGISFLPKDDNIYDQAPFETISEEHYTELLSLMPKDIDWSELSSYEKEDMTTNSKELACHGGACEVVDIVTEELS
jgi:ribonucleoside-diphosphate reductase alpha chain